MIFNILALLVGDVCVQLLPTLPSTKLCFLLLLLSMLITFLLNSLLFLNRWRQITILPLFFCMGILYPVWVAQHVLAWTLSPELEGVPLFATGMVSTLVNKDQVGLYFNFQLKSLSLNAQNNKYDYLRDRKSLIKKHPNNKNPPRNRLENIDLSSGILRSDSIDIMTEKLFPIIRLSWRDPNIDIKPGDELQVSVRLKRVHGMQNPAGFDMEKWAMQERVRAIGQVLPGSSYPLIRHSHYQYLFAQLRQYLRERIHLALPHSDMLPWITALTLGDRSQVSSQEWDVLRKTGTNHLMAIAGLHLGLIAAMTSWLADLVWRASKHLMQRIPRIYFQSVVAFIFVFIYAGLAGFSLPAQRACMMLFVFTLTLLCRRRLSVWTIWAYALLGVLLLDPLSVLSDSFWLSFVTIALVIYGMRGRLNNNSVWWRWGRIQWVIGFGLIPLSLYLFQECSLVSFIANCITIPWLACVVLPLCLISALLIFFSSSLGYLPLLLADAALKILWTILTWFSTLPLASIHLAIPNLPLLMIAMVGTILLLLPPRFPARWLGIIWWLPVIFYKPPAPSIGSVWMTVLDVGQGLSVVIRTTSHTLIYDAGPRFNDQRDSGEQVIIPYLYSERIKSIDTLVISHGDNDHIGGAPALLKAFTVKDILTSVPEKLSLPITHFCEAGKTWKWDGVLFTFLYPTREDVGLVNDSSCVLRIEAGNQSILLPGDIEKKAEIALLKSRYSQLASTIMVAPHHGSKTSGMLDYIHAVNPQYVVYATGYRNRYHLPYPAVVESYKQIGAVAFDTARDGAIIFKFDVGKAVRIYPYRATANKYWYD